MSYRRILPIEFCHCDPAGIVFYPRYVEMAQHVVENYFTEVLETPFSQMVAAGQGVPAARLEFDFRKPSRLGDRLEWVLQVEHIGRSSIRFLLNAEDRLEARITVVWIGEGFVPAPLPDPVRKRLQAHHVQGATAPGDGR
ncbi:acyl-CoA thioesterase [Paracoccus tegillarcae]|uniref:Thioesterase n=1 Tax=Paracoccus tegillarcae TaxID=1529068 RepID=A0A2K9EFR5_9RHOB|nr:acyl-CoA thioesterase [Paracoccus tegillarcae]AUH33798.1 thioesterase [Paracoccus tegillarcae]